MIDAELRESVRELGPLLPVYTCGLVVIDGKKRAQFAAETGHAVRFVELYPEQALKLLWVLHPERAIARLGPRSVDEYARAFGVKVLTVAKYLEAQRIEAPIVEPSTVDREAGLSRKVQLFVSPTMHHLAGQAARQRGLNLSAFVREAVATHLQRTLGVAPPPEKQDARSGPRASRTVPGVEHRPRQDTPDLRRREARAATRSAR
jgi:predicted HicB family RNase H-like nuclease